MPISGDPVSSNPLIEIAEQSVSLGKPENFPSYGWDNEYGQWNAKWVWVWRTSYGTACSKSDHNPNSSCRTVQLATNSSKVAK